MRAFHEKHGHIVLSGSTLFVEKASKWLSSLSLSIEEYNLPTRNVLVCACLL